MVAFASWPQEIILRGTLADIGDQMRRAGVTRTAVIIVGDVVAEGSRSAEGLTESYLYSADRSRGDRH